MPTAASAGVWTRDMARDHIGADVISIGQANERLRRGTEKMNSPERLVIDDLVAGLGANARAAVARLAREPEGLAPDRLPKPVRDELLARLPRTLRVEEATGTIRFRAPELAGLFLDALDDAKAPDAIVACILQAQTDGNDAEALRLFRDAGGVFFMHFFGMDACHEVLRGFPEDMAEEESVLVFASAMHALKAGNVSRARHLIGGRFGPEVHDLDRLLAQPDRFPVDLRLFRFLMAMYEDIPITDAMRARLFDALGEVPLDDHLQRGSFYNAMVEVLVRKRELDAASEVARRARFHYAEASAHLLGFYIDLYLTMLCLMRGALAEAEGHARNAAETLGRVPFDAASDERILALVQAIIRYERGDVQSLARFLSEDFDEFAYGENWPTLTELAINYGAQALSRHVAIAAARTFLDKWRVQEWRSNRFRLVITLREVAILQNGNRWQEAADLLTTIQSRVNRTWVEGAAKSLGRLVDPQEIAIVLAWLRHLIWEVPRRAMLRDQLAELLKNDHLTERQRIAALVWSADLARMSRDMTTARAALLKALEASARFGTIMPLVEEAGVLDRLLKDKRIGPFVLASGETSETVRKIRAIGNPVPDGARRAGLTRQEAKVLLLVVEGSTNKHVARQLGLSEVTVKFHLSNIYRKIGCRRRTEAVAAAKALGWVA